MSINVKGLSRIANEQMVADWTVETSSSDWKIELDTQEDYSPIFKLYYKWNEGFMATHVTLGSVVGDASGDVICYPISDVLEELEQSFNENVECELGEFCILEKVITCVFTSTYTL